MHGTEQHGVEVRTTWQRLREGAEARVESWRGKVQPRRLQRAVLLQLPT